MKAPRYSRNLLLSLRRDLQSVYEVEFGSQRVGALSKTFFRDLRHVFELDGTDDIPAEKLSELARFLDKWSTDSRGMLNKLWKTLPNDHPVKCSISLFGTMDYGRLEVAHTRTLAWLLNPKGEHGFGCALLKSLLRAVGCRETISDRHIRVESEQFYKDEELEDQGRTDIWIECASRIKRWLLVIEAKIDAREDSVQLSRYDRKVNQDFGGWTIHRILLTPMLQDSEERAGWKRLSFFAIAAIFCGELRSLRTRPGFHFLRFYLAGVLKDVLALPTGKSTIIHNQFKLLEFLKGQLIYGKAQSA